MRGPACADDATWGVAEVREWCRQTGCEAVAAALTDDRELAADVQRALIGGQPLPVDVRRALERALQGRLGGEGAAHQVQCLLERMGAHKQRVAASRSRTSAPCGAPCCLRLARS